ncbi:MAG TPA: AAA domain-containing protein [Polyangiales bacterium]|nr:AAA domain-containing protein [Polyangiales bacterium]
MDVNGADAQPAAASKILQRMLERLHAAMANGPLLQCRPYSSRQRIDLLQLGTLPGVPPAQMLALLLSGERSIKLGVPRNDATQVSPRDEAQALLAKLRTIAEDARTYEQDTGVHALFLGYPMLHLPPETRSKAGLPGKRILAPVAFIPVQLTVKTTRPASVVIECTTDGADLIVPNSALFAWLSQVTGHAFEELFTDEGGVDPWRELNELTAAVCRALELEPPQPLAADGELSATPRSDSEDPPRRAVIPAAVLGLFPVSKQGLLSDLQALSAGEPLDGPIQSFLRSGEELGLPESEAVQQRIASERCVGAADPCQLRAVRLARRASGLVVHGPPGTGKSQTITNIIADHLAAGERVLFVCDKRTALDVVHHRLDHLGLRDLCAVVHDARRDPRELYRAMREQLDALPDLPRDPACEAELSAADRELISLHSELAAYSGAIMDRPEGGQVASLHELAGEWFALDVPEAWQCELPELRPAELREQERDTREMLERGRKVGFAANPWTSTSALGIGLRDYLAHAPAHWQSALRELEDAAQKLDLATGSELLPFAPAAEIADQARARAALHGLLAEALERGRGEALATWAAAQSELQDRGALEHEAVSSAAALVAQEPLDRELSSAAGGSALALPELSLWLGKLASYLEIARKWYRFFYFGRRRAALPVVQRFGLALGYDAALRVQKLVSGMRARRILSDWYAGLGHEAPERQPPDVLLSKAFADYGVIFRILSLLRTDAHLSSVSAPLWAALRDAARHGELVAALQASQRRAQPLIAFDTALRGNALLEPAARARIYASACAHEGLHAEVVSLAARQSSIEDILRIRERLARLPDGVRAFHVRMLEQGVDGNTGWAALQKAVLCAELARRAAATPLLQELDADRIRATYQRYRALEVQRRELARRTILRRWTELQRSRLLASTGSRLNAAGAEVRRRLVSRGERALRMRQVIATGAAISGGDPLFDLRPVWMMSPEVVAQILPREPLFDLVVFDEASQCRLEEALPVLTRARRVVIAGDPKQLPPTRFFELAGVQSQADVEPETEQELFEEQQGEVEDLLGAALNLSIEQAYLDVHYRSQNADLIEFSNRHFYDARLQPIPAHPSHVSRLPPLRLHHVGGVYDKRANPKEAEQVVRIVRELLGRAKPPSIGVACFNLSQRDAIVEALERAAAEDAVFGAQLSAARARRGTASFEGLFVKNLENVQGDERDQIIISTTYGPDAAGRFYRRFGPLGQPGGGRRLNVLITRAREAVHIVTSIPRDVYASLPAPESGRQPNGAWLLFAYLSYAEQLAAAYDSESRRRVALEAARPGCRVLESSAPSQLAASVGRALASEHDLSGEVHWGNDGFGVDVAVTHPSAPEEVTVGVLCDATRFDKAPDRVQWDIFRSEILEAQGWRFVRLWTPQFVREPAAALETIADEAERHAAELRRQRSGEHEQPEQEPLAN